MPPLRLPPPPWIAAHRGDPEAGLENTLPALAGVPGSGAHLVELDVQLTADGELVVFHDWDLARLAGRAELIEEMAAEQVAALALEGGGHRGEIPTLAAALAQLPRDVANLEPKRRHADPERLLDRLEETIGDRGQILVSSFDHALLERLAARRPDLPRAPLGSRDAVALEAAGRRLGAFSLHAHRRLATRLLPRPGDTPPLLVYTVDDPVEARALVAAGAAGVFTDRPRRLAAAGLA